jgi:hypothetical protein
MRLTIFLCALLFWQSVEEWPAPEGWRRVTTTETNRIYIALRPPVQFTERGTVGTEERFEPRTDTKEGQAERREAIRLLEKLTHDPQKALRFAWRFYTREYDCARGVVKVIDLDYRDVKGKLIYLHPRNEVEEAGLSEWKKPEPDTAGEELFNDVCRPREQMQ